MEFQYKVPGGKTITYPSLTTFTDSTGHEKHGMITNYAIFKNASIPDGETTYNLSDYDLRLKSGADVIDKGVAIAQITDGFTGKAPDLGAYELSSPGFAVGPRALAK